jgi:hypothetical protein
MIGNLSKRAQRQQIGVAGNDQIGMTVVGELKKLVVRGVAACRDARADGYQLRYRQQILKSIACCWSNEVDEIWSRQDLDELTLRR